MLWRVDRAALARAAPLASISRSVASSFSCSQALFTPAHTPVTQAVGLPCNQKDNKECNKAKEFPGTLQHQRILRVITSCYENDPRISAIIVFGSLGRGTWDCYSDLDLDVVVADGIMVDVEAELLHLGNALEAVDEQIALLIPDDDNADVVFKSLMELSIRYHPLLTPVPISSTACCFLLGELISLPLKPQA